MNLVSFEPVIRSRDAVAIVRDTLCRVDIRLIHHGERVAYILLKLLEHNKEYTAKQVSEICTLGIFHDIGAYKTDEIDNMTQFETDNVLEHSIYGYLFLKHMSPLASQAESVLYHHFHYNNFPSDCSECRNMALLINMADRVDLLWQNKTFTPNMLRKYSGNRLDPQHVEMFIEFDTAHHIMDNLDSGAYRQELTDYLDSLTFSDAEINQYLRMLAYSIDFRSVHTVSHTINTVAFSTELASRFNFNSTDITKMYYGALLHDLGKIAIPLEILEFPGKLSHQAMEIMKTHVSITEEILKGVIDDEIFQIAVRHHEKIDGSGYPYGLKGDELTLSQRVLAVADIISALIGTRSYKEAYPKEKVLSVIAEMSDSGKLCPKVCHMVLSDYDQILAGAAHRSQEVLTTYLCISDEFQHLYHKLISG